MATSTFTNTITMNNDMVQKFDGLLSKSAPLKDTMAKSGSYRNATKKDIQNLRKIFNIDGQ
ncbi:hypothetical protein ACQ7AG_00890 [Lactococcus petauri]